MATPTDRRLFPSLQAFVGGTGLGARILKGGIGTALVNIANMVLSIGLGIVLARGLGADGYGVYAYALAIMSVLVIFAELGMPTLLTRELASREASADWPAAKGAFVRSFQIACANALVLACAGALATVYLYDAGSVEAQRTMLLMFCLLPIVVVLKVLGAALKALRFIVFSQVAEGLLRVVLVLVALSITFFVWPGFRSPEAAMAVQVAATLLVVMIALAVFLLKAPTPMKRAKAAYSTSRWLKSALPFTLIGGASIVNSQTDIIMLGALVAPADVGIYRVAMQSAALVAFVLQVGNTVVSPYFARLHASGSTNELRWLVQRSSQVVFLLTLPLAVFFVLFGGAFAALVFGPEFGESHMPLAILATGELVGASMGCLGFLLYMTGHEKAMLRVLALSAGLNILLNALLIPLFGTPGAATATALGQLLRVILIYRIVRSALRINPFPFGRQAA